MKKSELLWCMFTYVFSNDSWHSNVDWSSTILDINGFGDADDSIFVGFDFGGVVQCVSAITMSE